MINPGKLKVIHIAKNNLKMKDDDYRFMLQSHFNVTSSKDLTDAQFYRLMELFEKLGFKSLQKTYITTNQINYMNRLAKDIWTEGVEEKLKDFIKKQLHFEEELKKLSIKEAQKINYALEKIKKYKGENHV